MALRLLSTLRNARRMRPNPQQGPNMHGFVLSPGGYRGLPPGALRAYLIDPSKEIQFAPWSSDYEPHPGVMVLKSPQGEVPVHIELLSETPGWADVYYTGMLMIAGADPRDPSIIHRESEDFEEVLAALASDLKGIEKKGVQYFRENGKALY